MGNVDEEAGEEIIYELFLQAGPVKTVHLPRDRITGKHQGFGFVEFKSDRDAEYATAIMNHVRLFGKPLKVSLSVTTKLKALDVGAEIFVGGLDPMVDEGTLAATFSSFGNLVNDPKVARDEEGNSLGYGFVSFDNFDSSDRAIEAMNNQYLMNKAIHVAYAFKRDGKGGRHGDAAERLLAEEARKHNVQAASLQTPRAPLAPIAGAVPVGPGGIVGAPIPAGPPAGPAYGSYPGYYPPGNGYDQRAPYNDYNRPYGNDYGRHGGDYGRTYGANYQQPYGGPGGPPAGPGGPPAGPSGGFPGGPGNGQPYGAYNSGYNRDRRQRR